MSERHEEATDLFFRLRAAHCDESVINCDESAAMLAIQLGKLPPGPLPCHGELAPESRSYGPNGVAA